MSKPERIATIKFISDEGNILADINITKYSEERMYTLHDYISDKVYKIPFIVVSSFISYTKTLKDFTSINIEINEYR